jgi:hypothetical protein
VYIIETQLSSLLYCMVVALASDQKVPCRGCLLSNGVSSLYYICDLYGVHTQGGPTTNLTQMRQFSNGAYRLVIRRVYPPPPPPGPQIGPLNELLELPELF